VTTEQRTGHPISKRAAIVRRAILLIGSVGPLGHLPASGTVTVAALGIPVFWWFSEFHEQELWQVMIVLAFAGASMCLHHVGDQLLSEQDSRQLVWDELAGFLAAIVFLPFTWQLAVIAILLERALDVLKPPPANWIDRSWHGGVGVVADDLVAGAYTCVLLHVTIWAAPTWVGINPAA